MNRNRAVDPVATSRGAFGPGTGDWEGQPYFAGELCLSREEWRACRSSADLAALLDQKWAARRVMMLDRLDEGWERPKEG